MTKKITANLFYRILDSNSKVKLTRNAGDFKLISKKIVDIIKNSNDDDLYLRGLVDWYGGNKNLFTMIEIQGMQEKESTNINKVLT